MFLSSLEQPLFPVPSWLQLSSSCLTSASSASRERRYLNVSRVVLCVIFYYNRSNEEKLVFLKFLLLSILSATDTGAVDGKQIRKRSTSKPLLFATSLGIMDLRNAYGWVKHERAKAADGTPTLLLLPLASYQWDSS